MPLPLAAVGAAILAYVVYLISGVGVAVLAFLGIMLIVLAVYWWFHDTRANAIALYEIQTDQHYELMRVVHNIEKDTRKL